VLVEQHQLTDGLIETGQHCQHGLHYHSNQPRPSAGADSNQECRIRNIIRGAILRVLYFAAKLRDCWPLLEADERFQLDAQDLWSRE
jgi:hypothetical protein